MMKDEVLRTESQNCPHVTTPEGIEKFLNQTHIFLRAHGSPPQQGIDERLDCLVSSKNGISARTRQGVQHVNHCDWQMRLRRSPL
jgi:hypothetical protein